MPRNREPNAQPWVAAVTVLVVIVCMFVGIAAASKEPARRPPTTTTSINTTTTIPTANADPPYASCSDAHADGQTPLHQGHPRYNPDLDRDHDGTACDTSP